MIKKILENKKGIRKVMLEADEPSASSLKAKTDWDIIDFSGYNAEATFGKDTPEYKKLEGMKEEEWLEYNDDMAKYGIIVAYDDINDQFIVNLDMMPSKSESI